MLVGGKNGGEFQTENVANIEVNEDVNDDAFSVSL